MQPILECHHIKKKLPSDKSVKRGMSGFTLGEINFQLEPGYILGVIGENGAGKSTLAKLILAGMHMESFANENEKKKSFFEGIKATQERMENYGATGELLINGFDTRYHGRAAKEQCAFVLTENPFSLPLSAMQNVSVYASAYENWNQELFVSLMKQYRIPLQRRVGRLSKGQQILFQLAFAQSHGAKLYVMDEPSASLDVAHQQLLLDTMQEIVSDGLHSIVYITHRLEDLEQIGDYILWLEQGRQLVFESKDALLENYYEIVTGSKEQFQYVEQMKPDCLFWLEQGAYHQEALLAKQRILPLSLSRRKPTIQELMVYEKEYKKRTGGSLL